MAKKNWGMPTEPTPESMKERDIDEWAEDRTTKGENRQWGYRKLAGRPPKGMNRRDIKKTVAPITWIESLMEQGFMAPLIKQVTSDGRLMWFISDGIDYVADLTMSGRVFVEKAIFKPTLRQPTISYAPTQTNKKRQERKNRQGEPYTGDTIEESDDFFDEG